MCGAQVVNCFPDRALRAQDQARFAEPLSLFGNAPFREPVREAPGAP